MSPVVRPLLLLAALVAVLIGAAPASGAIRAASVDDAAGDTRLTLAGSRVLGDVKSVSAVYDDSVGDVTVRVTFHDAVAWLDYFSADMVMTQGDSCATASRTFDLSLNGYWVRRPGYSADSGGGSVFDVEGYLGARVNYDGSVLTFSTQAEVLKGKDYRCVGFRFSSGDEVGALRFGGTPPPPQPPVPANIQQTAPALNKTTYAPGDTISATSDFQAVGGGIRATQMVITARRPGVPHDSGPYDDFSPRGPDHTFPRAGASFRVGPASFQIPADAPTGRWESYATWQDERGVWHDGPSTFFEVARRVTPPTIPVTPTTPPNPVAPTTPTGPGTGSGGGTPTPTPTPSAGPVTVTTPSSSTPIQAPARDRSGAPEAALAVGSTDLRTLRRRGVPVRVICSETCLITLRLTTRSGRTLARGTATARRAGRATVRLRLTSTGRRTLRRTRSARLVLRGTVADTSGNRRSVRSTVRFD